MTKKHPFKEKTEKGEERKELLHYLARRRMKMTRQRELILRAFMESSEHVTGEDLYLKVKKADPGIGYTTVYRTLRLFCECGLAQERNFTDGPTLFEPSYKYEHHDHLICTRCGSIIEFANDEIESLQEQVAKEFDFEIKMHQLILYGRCKTCH